MGMVVRTNTMALNAYRQLGMNNSAVSKSLEKLSSGFRINRAGDDAAGLAISEKMKAQITGLETASANAQDGISLIQTAEGNLSEVHDMLNRMVELASKSANGTYTSTERQALQDEVDQLLDEIDRISQSANFNGTKLLDGSLNPIAAKDIIGDPTFKGMGEILDEFEVNDKPTMNGIQGSSVITHKDAVGDAKTSFELDLSNFAVEGLDEGDEITIKLNFNNNKDSTSGGVGGKEPNTVGTKDGIVTVGNDTTRDWEITIAADENGNVTADAIAKALVEATKTQDDDGNDVFTVALKPKSLDLDTETGGIEYSVSAEGNVLKFNMTNDGYKSAAAIYDRNMVPEYKDDGTIKQPADGGTYTGANPFSGHFNVGVTITDDQNQAVKTFSGLTDNSTSNINKGAKSAGTQLADVVTEPFNANKVVDGSGLKLGDTSYVFAMSNDTVNGKYGDNVKVIDLRDLAETNDDGVTYIKDQTGLHTALSRLTAAAADNKMWSVQQNERGDRIVLREKMDYNGDGKDGRADLTTLEGIQAQVQKFDSITANVTTTEATGKALTLQIGDTADDFNKMSVSIADMSATGLGLKDLSIMTEADASAAIDKVKTAINTVSTTRAGMGALQNRLEHTINNLDVAVENLSAANSRIRDTDMAKEMMNYTKMNVLVQSAQAMLAQANQQPQSVLQLLQ